MGDAEPTTIFFSKLLGLGLGLFFQAGPPLCGLGLS